MRGAVALTVMLLCSCSDERVNEVAGSLGRAEHLRQPDPGPPAPIDAELPSCVVNCSTPDAVAVDASPDATMPILVRSRMLGGADFRGSYGFGRLLESYQAESTWNYATIPLDTGTTIDAVKFTYFPDLGGVRPSIERLDPDGFVFTVAIGTFDVGPGVRTQTLTPAVTMDDTSVYWLRVELSDNTARLYSAKITYH